MSAREVAAWCKEVRRTADAIPAIAAQIQSSYSRSGEVLEELSPVSGNLVRDSEDLVRSALGQDSGELLADQTAKLLSPPLEYLEGWRSELMSRLDDLKACSDVLNRLQSSEATLRSVVSPLAHMQTMFRIESARLDENVRQVFLSLTDQI